VSALIVELLEVSVSSLLASSTSGTSTKNVT
jgi:hypothetical protein